MKPSEKIRIVFDGPPSHEGGRFIEVENEHAQSVSFGEWVEEGELWYLEFPNPAKLEAEIALKADYIKRLEAESEIPSDALAGAQVFAIELKAENEALREYIPDHVKREWEYYRALLTRDD